MICPACRQDAPENRAFCPYCGAALPRPSKDPSPEEPPPEHPTEPAEPADAGPPADTDEPDEGSGMDPQEDHDEGSASVLEEDDEEEPDRGGRSLERALGGAGTARAGIVRGVLLGALSFLVVALFAAVVAFAGLVLTDLGVAEIARIGGLVFLGFHHVGLRAEFPTFDPGGLPGLSEPGQVADLPVGSFDISYTVAVAFLSGTALALLLLYRAGRRAAEEGGGSPGRRALQGASVAIPYTALSVAVALVASFSVGLGEGAEMLFGSGGRVEISPSILSAVLWPLGLAVLAGVLGGLLSSAPDLASPRGRQSLAVIAGGGQMAGWLLVAGFVGLLVLAALSPDMTAAYVERVASDREGLQLLLATVLVLPNLVLWGLSIGMGGSIAVGEYLTGGVHVASLLRFPESIDPAALGGVGILEPGLPDRFGLAPVGYFVFIPLAIIGLVVAARRTAQRAEVETRTEGARIGAASGVVFAGAFVLALVLAGVGFRAVVGFGGSVQDQLGRVGPLLASGALVGLVWGVVGGALGGMMGWSAEAPAEARRPEPEDEEEPRGEEEAPLLPTTPTAESPPVVEVGTGPTGFEGLAASQQALVRGRPPAAEPEEAPPWETTEALPSASGVEPTEQLEGPPEPPDELGEPAAPPEQVDAPAPEVREPWAQPPAEPEPSEPEPEPEPEPPAEPEPSEPEERTEYPDWLPKALRPDADDVDEEDLEARWGERPSPPAEDEPGDDERRDDESS